MSATPIFNINFSGIIQRDFISSDGGRESPVYSNNPSSSILNDFIPYHALMSGKLLTISTGNSKSLIYSLDVSTIINTELKSYEEFFWYLYSRAVWVRLAKKNTVLDYRCRQGQLVTITEEGTVIPLVTLVVNKEHLFDINKGNPDFSKFFVVVSKVFSESEQHSNVYKNFCKYYLEIASKYVDVIYVKDILKFCYKPAPINVVKPKTIAELKDANKQVTYNIIRSLYFNEYT